MRRRTIRRRDEARFELLEGRLLPASLFVNPLNTTGVEDGTAAHPYVHIQAALDHAADGDAVNVAAGTYAEALRVDHAVSLIGPNAGVNPNGATRAAEAVIIPPTAGGNGINILVRASGVAIDGFTLDGHNAAAWGGTVLNGVTVQSWVGVTNVDVTGLGSPINGLTIQNDVIRNFTRFGVYGGADNYDGTSYVSVGNAIRNNRIDNMPTVDAAPIGTLDQGRGVSLEDSFYADVSGNVITRTATGIQAIYGLNYPNTSGYATTIANNQIQAYDRGVFVWTADDGAAQALSISGNTVAPDPTSGRTATAIGIDVERILGNSGVAIGGNTVSGFAVGVQVGFSPTTTPIVVSGGVLNGNDVGLRLTNASPPKGYTTPLAVAATLNGVTIQNSTVTGIDIVDALAKTGSTAVVTAGAGTTVTGPARGVALTGPGAKLVATAAPTVGFTQNPPATTTSTSASFAFSGSDAVSSAGDMTYRYQLDGGAWVTVTSGSINLTNLPVGAHTLTIEATNQGGLKSTATSTWTITTSSLPAPTLATSSDTGASNSDGVTRTNTPRFGGTVAPSVTVRVYANDQQIGSVKSSTTGTWSFTVGGTGTLVPSLADGTYAITIDTLTSAGVVSPRSGALTITVDRAAPSLSLSSNVMPAGSLGTPTIPVVFTGVTTDNYLYAPTVTYQVKNSAGKVVASGTAIVAADGSYRVIVSLPVPLVGATTTQRTYKVTFTSVDLAGNSTSTSSSFTLPKS